MCHVAGPVSESNDDDLCDDERLDMDEWPWVGECACPFVSSSSLGPVTPARADLGVGKKLQGKKTHCRKCIFTCKITHYYNVL